MFGPLGLPEILLILGLALLIFGPKRLPEMGRTIGRALGEFRKASNDLKRSIQFEVDAEEERQEREKRQPSLPASTIRDPDSASGPGSEQDSPSEETSGSDESDESDESRASRAVTSDA